MVIPMPSKCEVPGCNKPAEYFQSSESGGKEGKPCQHAYCPEHVESKGGLNLKGQDLVEDRIKKSDVRGTKPAQ